jgi:hypothetical protein
MNAGGYYPSFINVYSWRRIKMNWRLFSVVWGDYFMGNVVELI